MTMSISRSLRSLGAAILIAAAPVALAPAFAQVPAVPGLPTMGEAYDLTPELVLAWVESYPSLSAYGETLEGVDVPEGDDPMAAFAALGTVLEYKAQLDATVAQFGFTGFEQWTNVMFSGVFADALLDAPVDQQALLMGMFPQTQANLDAVSANYDLVQNLVDNL
ncbi:MAG: hypothetical protein ACTSWI_05200 [Alphaproteobacteria bacterium]